MMILIVFRITYCNDILINSNPSQGPTRHLPTYRIHPYSRVVAICLPFLTKVMYWLKLKALPTTIPRLGDHGII